jgi:hypothetical protein
MVTLLEAALGIDQDVGDVLDIAHFADPAAHFEQRIVMRRSKVGGVEKERAAETCAKSGGQGPSFRL